MKRYLLSRIFTVILLLSFGLVFLPQQPVLALPAGYQEFFLPHVDNYDVFYAVDSNIGTSNKNMHYVVGVTAAADNTVVYYDHWENGLSSGTTADETVSLNKGQVYKFESSNIPSPRGTSTRYDGGDRIYVSGSLLQLVVSAWSESVGTVLADAWEVYPVQAWQTSYTIPVGEALFSTYPAFHSVYAIVMSGSDSNTITIRNSSGSVQATTVLNRGQTYVYRVTGGAGYTITGTSKIETQLITGNDDNHYEMRGYTITPSQYWGNGYYTPVPSWSSTSKSELYLYNPNSSAITVNWEDRSGAGGSLTTGSFTIAAKTTRSYSNRTGHYIPIGSGAYIYTPNSEIFWGIGAGDIGTGGNSATWDWGYSLIPINFLGTDNYVSWAPGNRTLASGTVNGSPVYVTALNNNTTISVDYGPNNGVFDYTTTINRLQAIKIFDPDKDNTGMHLVSTGPVAVAWGEDSNTAGTGDPYLDVGYTTLPLPVEWIDVALNVAKTANPTAVSAGTASEFTIVVSVPSTAGAAVTGIVLVDTLPIGWTYQNGSTKIDGIAAGNPTITGNITSGYILTWNVNWTLNMGNSHTLTLRATPDGTAQNPSRNEAKATGTSAGITLTAEGDAYVSIIPVTINPSVDISKSGPSTYKTGDIITYTITVRNTGDTVLQIDGFTDSLAGTPNVPVGLQTLDIGESGSFTYTYTVPVGAPDPLVNTATIHYHPSGYPALDINDTAIANSFKQNPAIHISKSANPTSLSVPGTVTYTYTVTNTGNVTLNPVAVVDNVTGPVTLSNASLAPGATTTGTATFHVNQALLDAGSLTNSAVATGTPPGGSPVTSQDTKTVTFVHNPSISIHKTFAWTNGNGSRVGDNVTYTYTVTNTGNVTLNPVSVVDNITGTINLGSANLAPGAFTTGTATYTITEPDIDAGSQTNIAIATGIPPGASPVTAQDTKTVTFTQISDIRILKTFVWTKGNGSTPGDNVTYTYTVTNAGNSDLYNITVNDDRLGTITVSPSAELEPGETATGTATLTVTQEMLNAGSQTNTATAAAETPSHYPVTSQDNQTVTFIQISDIEITKTFDWTDDDGSEVGDNGTYTYTVINTGNTDLYNITVNDDKLGTISVSPSIKLKPGDDATGTAVLTVTQAMIDNATLTNTATATGTSPGGLPVTSQDFHTAHFLPGPSLDIVKTYAWTTGNGAHVGDNVTFSYTATNTGNVTLDNISVLDDKLGLITLSSASLAPGDNATGTAILTITEPDIDAGSQTNIAIASGETSSHVWVTVQDNQTVTFIQISNIQIDKTFNWISGNGSSPGDMVNYTYVVTNTGNSDLYNITVTDDNLGVIIVSPSAELEPGETATGTATLILTQAMLNIGSQTNVATVTGISPGGSPVTSQDNQSVDFIQGPSLNITKIFTWTKGSGSQVGDNVTYTYTVTNTGNVTLDNITVIDDKLGSIPLAYTSLLSGENVIGTVTLTLTQELLDSGSQTNIATASGLPPIGPAVTAQDTRTVTFISNPSISIQKTFEWTKGNGASVGDNVTYTYIVTNTGNVTLDPVTVTDDKLGAITLGSTALPPGEFTTGTAILTITEPDIDAGSQTNIATATGIPLSGPDVTSQDTQVVNFIQISDIQILKTFTWTTGDGSSAGDNGTFTYTVTNTGNSDLFNISVYDDKLGSIIVTPSDELEPGDNATGTAILTVTLDMIDNGTLTNTAVATGASPSGVTVFNTDSETVTFSQTPNIQIKKTYSWTKGNGSSVGDVVTFVYTVTNTGNTNLTNITVSDNKLGPIIVYPSANLGPGDNATGTATLVVTQDMLDAGSQTNIANAAGETLLGATISGLDTQTVNFEQNPSLNIAKSFIWTHGNGSQVGDNVTYTYTVTNTGNVTLDNITVIDDKLGAIPLAYTSLSPGENVTGTATLTLTQELLDTGLQDNIATAAGTSPGGSQVISQDILTVDFVLNPSIDIQKTYTWTYGNGSQVGDNVTYTYTVTNTGNVTLDNVTVYDDKLGFIRLNQAVLEPGEYATGTAVLTITEPDIDAGSQTNTATATGIPPNGSYVTSQETRTVHFIQISSIHIDKTFEWTNGNGSQVGDNLTFTYTVTNTGNSDLYNISVYDDKLGTIIVTPSAELEPGETAAGTATLTITQDMLDTGSQTNTATVAGITPGGSSINSSDTRKVDFIAIPSINITKSFNWIDVDGSGINDNGTYSFIVKNTGNVTLNPVTVTDDKLGDISVYPSKLEPGDIATGTAVLTVTQAMIDNVTLTNTATATGTPTHGTAVTSSDTRTIDFVTAPALEIIKTFAWTYGNGSHPGDNITYLYTVTNTGNVTLDNITLNDDKLGSIVLLTNSLSPGDLTTGTATYTITELDLDNGSRTNTALASGETFDHSIVTAQDTLTINFIQISDIEIVKTFAWTYGNGSHPGDNITYLYTVTNTGNVTLDNITVNDDKLGLIVLLTDSLSPGDFTTGTATYTITEPDLDEGSRTNIAVATGETPAHSHVTARDDLTVDFIQISDIEISKTFAWTSGDGSRVGDNITYTYLVTNMGNTDLFNISVYDDKLGIITVTPSAELEPGETATGTASMLVTQEMLDAGLIINTAIATGLTPHDTTINNSDIRTVHLLQSPSLSLIKSFTWTSGNGSSVGDIITYTYTVTNTGNIDLTNVAVNDDKLGLITLSSSTLAPGDNTTGTATLTVTQDILDAGLPIHNMAAANSAQGATATAESSVTLIQNPSIELTKNGVLDMTFISPDTEVNPGDKINYAISVKNTGNITLTDVVPSDPLLGVLIGPAGDDNSDGRLDISETWVYTGSYTIVQSDLDNRGNVTPADGKIHNRASVVARQIDPVTAVEEVLIILGPINPNAGPFMELTKTAGESSVSQAGDVIHYTITVKNTGDETLTNLVLSDPLLGGLSGPVGDNNSNNQLEITEVWIYTGSYTVTQADVDNRGNIVTGGGEGFIHNSVSATTSEITTPVIATEDVYVLQKASIHIEKKGLLDKTIVSPGTQANPGDLINYTLRVTNTGDIALDNVTITDSLLGVLSGPSGDTNSDGKLDVTETWIYTGVYTLIQSDIDSGKVLNTAEVSGTSPEGPIVNDTDHQTTKLTQIQGVGGEVIAIGKAGILGPWLILFLMMGIGASALILRRRQGG
jgi:uncharacterized repeat protein (TIGR01451 family)